MIKAAFFDIDGTLVSFDTHTVPPTAVRALQRMHERGIKLFIATGRSSHGMPPAALDLFERVPFDAFLTFNGQLCYDERGVYRDYPIDNADVQVLVDQASAGMYEILLMQRTRSFVSRHTERINAVEEAVGTPYDDGDLAATFEEPTYQICAYVDPGDEGQFMDLCRNVEHTRWCDGFCDVIPAGGGKPAGIAATLERFGLAPEECIAFGDGGNDIPMFGCVGTSVAMGNADDDVKAAASYVTSDIDEGGIWSACEHFGLL